MTTGFFWLIFFLVLVAVACFAVFTVSYTLSKSSLDYSDIKKFIIARNVSGIVFVIIMIALYFLTK